MVVRLSRASEYEKILHLDNESCNGCTLYMFTFNHIIYTEVDDGDDDDDDDDDFCNDNVPALSSDVLMAAVVRLLPFTAATAPLSPKLRVQLFAFANF